jgi:putative transposase
MLAAPARMPVTHFESALQDHLSYTTQRGATFHSDQGCQFTSSDFVARLQPEAIKISWSGRKRCYDNILVERLWRTVKYEEVYLRAYSDGLEAEISLARFLWRYCHIRPHSSLRGRTPLEVYNENQSCSSRSQLTMSGSRIVQYKAPTSDCGRDPT